MLDKAIITADRVLRALSGVPLPGARPSPARTSGVKGVNSVNGVSGVGDGAPESLDAAERRHSSSLMRVNHTGEVCAQALYQGQAMTSRSKAVKAHLRQAASEEQDHLTWCAERLTELGGRPSLLNPAFYAASFCVGAGVGLFKEKVGLGFVSATEDEVCHHLDRHLESLPEADQPSRAVLEAMREEEAGHGTDALRAGGAEFPQSVKKLMRLTSTLMTKSTYRI